MTLYSLSQDKSALCPALSCWKMNSQLARQLTYGRQQLLTGTHHNIWPWRRDRWMSDWGSPILRRPVSLATARTSFCTKHARMYYRSETGKRWSVAAGKTRCCLRQQISQWNDVMAAILKWWRQIGNPPPSVDAYLRKEHYCRISSRSDLYQSACCKLKSINGDYIDWVSSCRYLGVWLTASRHFKCDFSHSNKTAELSQRPRDAPNIWVPWKSFQSPHYAPDYFSRNL